MKTALKSNLFFLALAVTATILIYSCGTDTVTNTTTTPDAGTISGTITFVDTTRVYNNGYYDISAYSSWPPAGPPSASDTIKITKNNNVYNGTYKIKGLTGGASYVLAAAWIKTPYGPGSVYVLGLKGCDTVETCYNNPTPVVLPSSQGLADVNFKAFIDTSKTHVKF